VGPASEITMKHLDITPGFSGGQQQAFYKALLSLHLQHSSLGSEAGGGIAPDVQWSMRCSRVGDLRALCNAFIRITTDHIQEVCPHDLSPV